jgi:transposase InsO family protein
LAALVARFVEGEAMNVTAQCRRVGCSTKTFYKYVARFRGEGVEGFYPRSRAPLSAPHATSLPVEDVIVRARKELAEEGWDAGADQVLYWIQDHPQAWPEGSRVPSRATVHRILVRRGLVVSVPQRRPASSRRRFEADQPNSLWQMDGFETRLADGAVAVVLQLNDDCSRFDLALAAATSENSREVWACVVAAMARYGMPRAFLTDNGTAFSGKRRGWISHLEENLRAVGVKPITSSVGHPQTCGKNERAHATVQKWLAKQPPPRDLAELQRLLDTYRGHYNEHRRKKHLHGMTPGQRYRLGPQDGPGSAPLPAYLSVTTGKVSTSGCVGIDGHLFSVGRRHAHQLVTLIKQGRQVAIFSRDQLLAEVQLTGHRGYQRRLS